MRVVLHLTHTTPEHIGWNHRAAVYFAFTNSYVCSWYLFRCVKGSPTCKMGWMVHPHHTREIKEGPQRTPVSKQSQWHWLRHAHGWLAHCTLWYDKSHRDDSVSCGVRASLRIVREDEWSNTAPMVNSVPVAPFFKYNSVMKHSVIWASLSAGQG